MKYLMFTILMFALLGMVSAEMNIWGTGTIDNEDSWLGCRGNGAKTCEDALLQFYNYEQNKVDEYYEEHELCVKNTQCSGSFYACSVDYDDGNNVADCPRPQGSGYCGDGICQDIEGYSCPKDCTHNEQEEEEEKNIWGTGTIDDEESWLGCRGNGAKTCEDALLQFYNYEQNKVDEYYEDHELCVKNTQCSGSFYACSVDYDDGDNVADCPRPQGSGYCGDEICQDIEGYSCPKDCTHNIPTLPETEYKITKEIYQGWNIIPYIQNMEVTTNCDIERGYVYNPNYNEYFSMNTNNFEVTQIQTLENLYGPIENMIYRVAYSGAWIYSNENCDMEIEYESEPTATDEPYLKKGWNFVQIPEWMIGKEWQEVTGTCNINRIYSWNSQSQTWEGPAPSNFDITDDKHGEVLIAYTTNTCKLGFIDNANPPALPN